MNVHSSSNHSTYLCEIHFALSYCNHVVVHIFHNAFVHVKLHFLFVWHNFSYQKHVGLQFGHPKYICDLKFITFAFLFNANNNGLHFDGFGHANFIQTHVACINYLIDYDCYLCKVMCFVAPESMIHLQALFKSLCVVYEL